MSKYSNLLENFARIYGTAAMLRIYRTSRRDLFEYRLSKIMYPNSDFGMFTDEQND